MKKILLAGVALCSLGAAKADILVTAAPQLAGDTLTVSAVSLSDVMTKSRRDLQPAITTTVVTADFTVVDPDKRLITDAVLVSTDAKVFTGSAIELEGADLKVTYKDVSGAETVLTLGAQYTLEGYTNNVNAGTATVLQMLSTVFVMLFTCVMGRHLPKGNEFAGLICAFVATVLIATQGDLGTL